MRSTCGYVMRSLALQVQGMAIKHVVVYVFLPRLSAFTRSVNHVSRATFLMGNTMGPSDGIGYNINPPKLCHKRHLVSQPHSTRLLPHLTGTNPAPSPVEWVHIQSRSDWFPYLRLETTMSAKRSVSLLRSRSRMDWFTCLFQRAGAALQQDPAPAVFTHL